MVKLGDYIDDIAAGPFGSNLKVECFVEDGFPIIDGANLRGFTVTDNVTKFVTEEKARSLHRSIATRGEVIVTISGNVGQIAYIPNNSQYDEYLVSQRQFRVRFKNNISVPYLVYYMHSREGQYKILSFANQTGVPALAQPLKNFRNIELPLPPLETQRRIAAILSSLDDKIENNTRINRNLEAQAQALFKSWFGEETNTVKLSEVSLNVTDGVHNTVIDDKDGEYLLLSCKNIVGGQLTINSNERRINQETFEKLRKRTKLAQGDILISTVGTVGEVVLLFDDPTNIEFQRSVGLVKPDKTKISSAYMYCALRFKQNTLKHIAHGAVQQCIFIGDLKDFEIPYSSMEKTMQFDNIVSSIFYQISANIKESARLAALRDTLLPKLMKGEIEV